MINLKSISVFLVIMTCLSCGDLVPKKKESKITEVKNTAKEFAIYDTVFPSTDGLLVSATVYPIDDTSQAILLCHQARFNKFEYEGIAQELNKRGYNCVAIDQRSGGRIANVINETYFRAIEQNKGTTYIDAEKDIEAGIAFTSKLFNDQKIILWGSSYSSTLALYLAPDNPLVKAVVAFSPGDYLSEEKGSLKEALSTFRKPFFITSSKEEILYTRELLSETRLGKRQMHHEPQGEGFHGSKALWQKQPGGLEYWNAIEAFLNIIKN